MAQLPELFLNCTKPQELEDLLKHLEGWSDTRPEDGEVEAVVDQYSGFLDKAEEEVKNMPPGADRSEQFMKTLGALLTSSTLKIAGKTPQFKVHDLQEGINVSNAHEVMVPAVPKEQLREDMVHIVSLLNLPSMISTTPYATEYAVKHILTTYINALMKEGLPIPRFLFAFEADEEVGGELPTVTTMNFCTSDGKFKMSRAS